MNDSALKTLRIAVLDDEPLVLASVTMLLTSLGSEVIGTSNSAQLLRILESGTTCDIAIIDVGIIRDDIDHEGTSNGVITRLRKVRPQLSLLATSGDNTLPMMERYSEFGFAGALAKPFGASQLREMIDSLFEIGSEPN